TGGVELNLPEVEVHGTPADAVTPDPADITLLVDGAAPGELTVGATVDVSVEGLFPESPYAISLTGSPAVLAEGVADINGDAAATVTVPALTAGQDTLRLTGFNSEAYQIQIDTPVTIVEGEPVEPVHVPVDRVSVQLYSLIPWVAADGQEAVLNRLGS